MYTDILMNGTKRFVVAMSHPAEPGRFAQMGVLFELEELKEVSEQTNDQIKYICNHKVTGRVQVHQIVNPEAWESRETYLRVEGTIYDDSVSQQEVSSSNNDVQPGDVYSKSHGLLTVEKYCRRKEIIVTSARLTCDSPGAYYYGSKTYRGSEVCIDGDKVNLKVHCKSERRDSKSTTVVIVLTYFLCLYVCLCFG